MYDLRPHPKQRAEMDRRMFLRRAAAAGIALPSMAAILAACGNGAQNGVASTGPSGTNGGSQFGSGGIAGAAYPLARQDAPVTWTVQADNPVIEDGLPPEEGVTLQVLRWPYYIDQGILNDFKKKYNCKVVVTEFSDMEGGLKLINSGQGDFDIIFGVSVWALGRQVAAGHIRPINHTYLTNMANLWDQFQSPFYDVGSQFSLPYSVWTTGIFGATTS